MRSGAGWIVLVLVGACGTSGSPSAPAPAPSVDAGDIADGGAPSSRDEAGADASAPRLDLGVTFSPIGFGGPFESWSPNRPAFYDAVATHGRVVAYHFGWRDPGAPRPACGTPPGILQLVKADAATRSFSTSIVLGWASGDGEPDLACEPDATNSWSNATTRAKYKEVAVAIATELRPAYLWLGNEVNSWYLTHPGDWAAWVSELADVAGAVRAASPSTLVGTIFQLDRMRGNGAKNGWKDPPHFELVADVADEIDVLGITAYPFFDADSVAAVPADYFSEVLSRFAGPIAVTETAWRAEASVPYPGGAAEQSAWATRLFELLAPPRLRYAVWLFLDDPAPSANQGPFLTTGLRDPSGAPRPVDATWQELVKARQSP